MHGGEYVRLVVGRENIESVVAAGHDIVPASAEREARTEQQSELSQLSLRIGLAGRTRFCINRLALPYGSRISAAAVQSAAALKTASMDARPFSPSKAGRA